MKILTKPSPRFGPGRRPNVWDARVTGLEFEPDLMVDLGSTLPARGDYLLLERCERRGAGQDPVVVDARTYHVLGEYKGELVLRETNAGSIALYSRMHSRRRRAAA